MLLAKSIPYTFGQPLAGRRRFLKKWRRRFADSVRSIQGCTIEVFSINSPFHHKLPASVSQGWLPK